MQLTPSSQLKMHNLKHRIENDSETLIGRTDISDFIILPNIAIEIINLLDKDYSIQEVQEIIYKDTGEHIDIMDFAHDLIHEYKFVYTVDGIIINDIVHKADHFSWIPEKTGDILFNRFAYILYFSIFFSGLILAITHTEFFPKPYDFFIVNSHVMSLGIITFSIWILIFFHELAHLISARSLKIGSRIGLSHRLVFMVAETDMSNIVLIPPQKRFRAYLAGMAWDGALLGIGIWVQFINQLDIIPIHATIISLIKMLNISLLISLVFQFMFFMKTDIYYVFVTIFKCNNLLENTNLYLRSFFKKQKNIENDNELENISPHERNVIKWYSVFYIIGICWALYFFFFITLPLSIQFIKNIFYQLNNTPILSWQFIDGIIMIIITLIPILFVIISWFVGYLRNNKIKQISQ
ncbi:PqqD family protein [Bacillus wiedmannii]|uniref:hypothetical protein n=1 Tax=Bacillus TaxID=1386 RepID=UPI000BF83FF2|nr:MULTISPECIES: hypothetical protein [Bacillus]MDI6508085.1 PqqD family protein [Bacillus wiedmannii]MDI6513858.1 PqqD family protein [Bacillus wiedmannii]PGC08445.1 hypothetical protein COM08_31800 [Bacillus wiedmannii]HDR7657317.1 PqqD family protein [Bacillus wiedmannii]HDR7870626.1 PqqD family protein [Bacillus wiedmannii]